MSFEGKSIDNQEKQASQKLEEMLPFLNQSISQEEIEYEKRIKEAADLMAQGKIDEAIKLSMELRGKKACLD